MKYANQFFMKQLDVHFFILPQTNGDNAGTSAATAEETRLPTAPAEVEDLQPCPAYNSATLKLETNPPP